MSNTQVAAQKAVQIKDAARLPGAFLLFRFTTKDEGTFAGISYDATITDKTTLKQLQEKYIINGGGAGFPYIEKFNNKLASEGVNIWKVANQISYAGVFGGPDPDHKHNQTQSNQPPGNQPPSNQKPNGQTPNNQPPPQKFRSELGPEWPWGDIPNHPIRHGVYVSFWFLGEGGSSGKGMHTSSTGKHLDKDSAVPYMWLQPGQPDLNLVPVGATIIRRTITGVFLDWYATLDNKDFGWSQEKDLVK